MRFAEVSRKVLFPYVDYMILYLKKRSVKSMFLIFKKAKWCPEEVCVLYKKIKWLYPNEGLYGY